MKTRTFQVRTKKRAERVALVDFLAQQLGLSKKKTKSLIDSRCVFVNAKRTWMAKHTLQFGDTVEVHAPDHAPEKRRFKVLYKDAHYLVVDKPAGVVTNGPPESLEALLRKDSKDKEYPKAVHRLDTGTSGCILLAKHALAAENILPLFRKHEVRKVYRAIVLGQVRQQSNRIETPIAGKTAKTEFQVLKTTKVASLLKVRIATGRTHQIRIHMSSIGHPVAGDRTYAPSKLPDEALRNIPRQMLHAETLTFPCPFTGKEIACKAALPKDFKTCQKALGVG